MRIGLAQLCCEKGAIAQNTEQMVAVLAAAEEHEVAVVGFPEMSLTGYADPTRFPHAVITLDGPELAALAAATRPYAATALVGLIEANPAGKPFITQVALRRGALCGVYRKVTIEAEEADWFAPGAALPLFQHDGLAFGIAICADIINPAVFAAAREQGASLVFELAAPGLFGDQATRDWESGYRWWEQECQDYLSGYARQHELWIAVATQVGRTCDEDFPGGAFVFSPRGERVFATADGQAGVVFLELDTDQEAVRIL